MALAAVLTLPGFAAAQLPSARLFTVFPPGGKQGTTFDATVGGADLDDARELFFSQPGITAVRKMAQPGPYQKGPQPVPNQFVVSIAPDAQAGVCDVRVAGKFGVSNPRAFQVGVLNEASESEPNNAPAQAQVVALETTVNGAAGGGADTDSFKLALKAGQRVFVDCWAQRIDSRLDGVLVLHDAAGKELDRNRDANRRDPLLDFTAPADGEFVVRVYDAVYGGSAEHFYRLSVSTAPRVDFVLPPSGLPGTKAPFVLYGRSLPGGQPAPGIAIAGKPLQMLPVEIELPGGLAAESLTPVALTDSPGSAVDAYAYRVAAPPGITEPILISFATAPVVLEAEPNNAPAAAQKITAPCEAAGQFFPQNDEDWFAFDVKQGDVFVIEVISQRLGLLTDPFLLVQHVRKNEKGEEQVQELQGADDLGGNVGGAHFDTGTDDAAFRLQSPADGACRVLVRDQYSATNADPRSVYRLSIRRESPDFRLVAAPRFPGSNPDPGQTQPNVWNPLLRRGGTETIQVYSIRRDGFQGEIQVSIEGLPSWVTCPGAVIGPGQSSAALVLAAAPDAVDWAGPLRIAGRSRVGGTDVARAARAGTMVLPGVENQIGPRSRVARGLALAVSGEPAPFLVEAGRGAVLEMSRAGTLPIPIALTRRGDFKGNVALAAFGLPPNVQPKNITLDANTAAGSFELAIQPNAPLGTFTLYLHATSQVSYSRNPEVAKAAADRKAEIDALVPAAAADAKKSAAEKAAADKTAAEAATAVAKAAEAQSKAAADGKAAADQVKAAADEVKKLVDAVKAAADKAASEAEARSKAAVEAQAAATKLATDTANAAKPQNVSVAFASTAVSIRITAAPITVTAFAPRGPLKQGSKVDIPVVINRLHGYAEPVQVTVVVPQGIAGLSIPAVTVPKDQDQVVVTVAAAADATAGQHALVVQATAKLNGKDLQASQGVQVTVEKP